MHPTKDANGINRYDKAELDAVKKEREADGKTPRLTSDELALARAERADEVAAMRDFEAWSVRFQAQNETDDRLRVARAANDAGAPA